MPQACALRLMTLLIVVLLAGAAEVFAVAALPSAPARADILPYGGGPRPPPRPFSALYPIFLEMIRDRGFDCPQIDDVTQRAPAGEDPSTYQGKGLDPYTVTCRNGKRFFVALPPNLDKARGAVTALD